VIFAIISLILLGAAGSGVEVLRQNRVFGCSEAEAIKGWLGGFGVLFVVISVIGIARGISWCNQRVAKCKEAIRSIEHENEAIRRKCDVVMRQQPPIPSDAEMRLQYKQAIVHLRHACGDAMGYLVGTETSGSARVQTIEVNVVSDSDSRTLSPDLLELERQLGVYVEGPGLLQSDALRARERLEPQPRICSHFDAWTLTADKVPFFAINCVQFVFMTQQQISVSRLFYNFIENKVGSEMNEEFYYDHVVSVALQELRYDSHASVYIPEKMDVPVFAFSVSSGQTIQLAFMNQRVLDSVVQRCASVRWGGKPPPLKFSVEHLSSLTADLQKIPKLSWEQRQALEKRIAELQYLSARGGTDSITALDKLLDGVRVLARELVTKGQEVPENLRKLIHDIQRQITEVRTENELGSLRKLEGAKQPRSTAEVAVREIRSALRQYKSRETRPNNVSRE
jgi:hypothetical protein